MMISGVNMNRSLGGTLGTAARAFAVAALCAAGVLAAGDAAPAPYAQWYADSASGGLKAAASNGPGLTSKDVRVTTEQGREAMRVDAGGSCATDAPVGDGWETLTLVADVFLENPKAGYQAVVCRDRWGGPDGDVYGLVLSPGGEWMARARTATGQRAISAPAGPGWHHVALTYDGSALRLYVDGTQAARAALAGALVGEPDTPLAFCTYSGGANGHLSGALRSVGVWRECLSEAQVSALAAAWRREVTAAQAAGFRFVQASDTHVTDTRSVEIVNAAVDRINAEQDVAFSLWLGDLTQNSTADQMVLARLALQRLAKPHYVLRGNHDSSGGHFEKEFGPLRRRIEYGGWVFLLADSNPGDKTPLSETDRDWLREQLATIAPETSIVLCTHHPLMPHTRSYLLAGSEEVLALFDRHALKACLSGHYHGNQQETVNGVLFTTTACLATTRNNFDGTQAKGYRVFECRDGTISTTFAPVTDE